LEEESKTTKIELERLNHEIADKEDQLADEKKKLEDNKGELAELKTHNDKFE
jgi:cell division protein FtsL